MHACLFLNGIVGRKSHEGPVCRQEESSEERWAWLAGRQYWASQGELAVPYVALTHIFQNKLL
jgi:hypothetical protein